MAAEPLTARVVHLEPPRPEDPRDAALVDLARELATERSAGKAAVAALKQLESTLVDERWTSLGLRAQVAELSSTAASQAAELKRQGEELQAQGTDLDDRVTQLRRQYERTARLEATLATTREELEYARLPFWRRLGRR